MYKLSNNQKETAKWLIETLGKHFKISWVNDMEHPSPKVFLWNYKGTSYPDNVDLTKGSLESLSKKAALSYRVTYIAPYETWECTFDDDVYVALDNDFEGSEYSFNTYNFFSPVGQIITGDQTVTGDNIGNQTKLVTKINQFLQEIEKKIIDPTSKAGKKELVVAALKEVENKPSLKKRLIVFLQVGTFEAIKKFSKNPYIEVFITAFKAAIDKK